MSGISAFVRRGRDTKEIQKCSLSTCMHQGKAGLELSENAPLQARKDPSLEHDHAVTLT